MADLAKMIGWPTQRMRRYIKRLNKVHGKPTLIRGDGRGPIMVTLFDMRTVWPEFGKRLASNDDLRDLHEEHVALKRDVRAVAAALREFREKSFLWFSRVDALEKRLGIAHQAASASVKKDSSL